jgi:hypothetical protein
VAAVGRQLQRVTVRDDTSRAKKIEASVEMHFGTPEAAEPGSKGARRLVGTSRLLIALNAYAPALFTRI